MASLVHRVHVHVYKHTAGFVQGRTLWRWVGRVGMSFQIEMC